MKDLFGNDSIPPLGKVKGLRIAERLYKQLIMMHGGTASKKCKNCIFLKRFHQGGKVWSKCSNATLDGHLATDWRAGWSACGLFKPDEQ